MYYVRIGTPFKNIKSKNDREERRDKKRVKVKTK